MKKLLVVLVVLAFTGTTHAYFEVLNAGFEDGWYTSDFPPYDAAPVYWASWSAPPNLKDMYPIAGNPDGATPDNGVGLEVLPGNTNGGYCFLWTLLNPTVPENTMLTMSVDVIDLTPGGASGDFAGLAISGTETKLTGVIGAWQTFSVDWYAGPGVTEVELMIVNSTDQVAEPGDTPCVYGFDNVRLIPEPMTIALLGLGGLLLRRRK